MKTILFCFALLAWSAHCVPVDSDEKFDFATGDLDVGQDVAGQFLAYNVNVVANRIPFLRVTRFVNFFDLNLIITRITATSLNGYAARVVLGGPQTSFALLSLTSQVSQALNYNVKIYCVRRFTTTTASPTTTTATTPSTTASTTTTTATTPTTTASTTTTTATTPTTTATTTTTTATTPTTTATTTTTTATTPTTTATTPTTTASTTPTTLCPNPNSSSSSEEC